MHPEAKRPVKTVETAFELLEIIKRNNGATLAEIADEHDIAKSTAHRHLQTLVRSGFVVKKDRTYGIGLKFLEYGIHARRIKSYRLAKAKTKELAQKTAERVQFIVEENGRGIYVYRKTGENAVHTDPGIGKPCPLHATAAGKAILSQLPEERVGRIIENRGLPRFTDSTITDEATLYRELEEGRERNYCINNQENIDGIRGLGAPILSKDGDVIGALSVSGPVHRFSDEWFEKEVPKLVLGATNEIELNAAYAREV